MKLIFSRKGFDSASGGAPSPIFPDGGMLSLPIPDRHSNIQDSEIGDGTVKVGRLVEELTQKSVPESYYAHLDPDLRRDSLPRDPRWRPIFGQAGAAQGHLRNQGLAAGDMFLFFGLFRRVIPSGTGYQWDPEALPRHVIWGWLQIGDIMQVDSAALEKVPWAEYHPHFRRAFGKNNFLYVSRRFLEWPNPPHGMPGAGVFANFNPALQLTSPDARRPSTWRLPPFFMPGSGRRPLSYHHSSSRWRRVNGSVELDVVSRGQEFVLDCGEYTEVPLWVSQMFRVARK